MPEPLPMPRASGPVPHWPDTLPNPQGAGFTVLGPLRAEVSPVLFGVARLAVRARTAPMQWVFECYFTQEQMQTFEGWYRDAVENHDGEFYTRWIGGSRVVAFATPYEYAALGKGWTLRGTLIRTRTDESICDEHLSTIFGAIYRADLGAVDIYQADLAAPDIYKDDFPLDLIAANEC